MRVLFISFVSHFDRRWNTKVHSPRYKSLHRDRKRCFTRCSYSIVPS